MVLILSCIPFQVEDRPIVKEIKTYVREHHPVEKEFVVETRPTGELPPSAISAIAMHVVLQFFFVSIDMFAVACCVILWD